jgi:hypothetical protein
VLPGDVVVATASTMLDREQDNSADRYESRSMRPNQAPNISIYFRVAKSHSK